MKLSQVTIRMSLLAFALAALPSSLLAKGDPAEGQKKSQVCQACHNVEGKTVDPTYPILAGQHESYLVKALGDYRAGRRSNPIMSPMAVNLTDQDILDLAAWYSSQDGLKDLSIK